MDEINNRQDIHVLLLGETGSGKSHLISTLYGKDAVPISGFNKGTAELKIIKANYKSKKKTQKEYTIYYYDTKGLLDPSSNTNNTLDILNEIKQKTTFLNYIFITMKYNRYNFQNKGVLETLFNRLKITNFKLNIKIFITYCDGWTNVAKIELKNAIEKSLVYPIIKDYEISFIGSFDEGKVDTNLVLLNVTYKDNTKQMVADIFDMFKKMIKQNL